MPGPVCEILEEFPSIPKKKSLKDSKVDQSTGSKSAPLSYVSRMYDLDGDGVLDETEKQLRELDHGDGHLDIQKVYDLLLQQKQLNQRFFSLKKFTGCLFLMVVVLALANLGTAFVAARLAKDTETHEGILVDRHSGRVIQTDNVVREIHVVESETRRRNQEGTVSSTTGTTIGQQAAADLFNYCAQGTAIIDLQIPDGHQVLVVCPADAFTQRGDEYLFIKGDKDLTISCASDTVATDGEEAACTLSGSMLQQPTYEPPTGGGLFGDNPTNSDLYTIPTYNQILYASYEDGSVNSGIEQLTGTTATATDAAYVANLGVHQSNHSICHKALLNDTSYYDPTNGIASSQTDTLNILATRYAPGTEFIYKFSLLLPNWPEFESGPAPMDVIWQFQHALGEPDAMLGRRRNSLYLRYGKSTSRFRSESIVIADLLKYHNQWLDIEAHIRWEYTQDTGFIRLRVQTPEDPEPVMVFQIENYKTFTDNGSGDFGYIKWGLYRPESTLENTPTNLYERIACHDNVEITAITYT